MRFFLNLNQSLEAIRSNAFRAGVTIFIIALGITALVVVRTAIEGIKVGMSSSFSSLGANTFRIINRPSEVNFNRRGRDRQTYPPLTYREAKAFQEAFGETAPVSLSSPSFTIKVVYGSESTNPNVSLFGTDQYYPETAQRELAEGRFLSEEDLTLGRNVCVIGYEVKETLMPYGSALGKKVNLNGFICTVVGVFEKIGTSGLSGGADRTVMVPITTLLAQQYNLSNFTVSVFAAQAEEIDYLMAEARGTMRVVRGLPARESDNFSVAKSDAFVEQLVEQLSVVTITAQVIALITLLGASVALLNVMLVSVTERTREIGLRKALGATKSSILGQFLWEAIMICQVGALLGIAMGVLGGNVVSRLAFQAGFVVPWDWILIGMVACLLVGVASGLSPARKAAAVDPIEALRHH